MSDYTGQALPRLEDARLLTGAGRFTADVQPDNLTYTALVRSPYGHARILGVDVRDASSSPGVLGVYTCDDLLADGVSPLPCYTRTPPFALLNTDGSEMPEVAQWVLARDKVRHVGEPVVFVVAESASQALDAAERVEVDYEPLIATVDPEHALSNEADLIWDDRSDNRSLEYERGDRDETQAAFSKAAHICRIEAHSTRQIVAFLEPRGIVAAFDEETGRLTLNLGCSSAHQAHKQLSAVLGIAEKNIRVIADDVGGAFGGRGRLYHEFVLVAWAARHLCRPVKWIAERADSFTTDTQARDQRMSGALALDADGRFLGLEVSSVWRHGAYLPGNAVWVLLDHMAPMICGVYQIPAAYIGIHGVFSNTAAVAPFRGIARAEAAYFIERLVDAAAREIGVDRLELRRRNLIRPPQMPWTTPVGAIYSEGDFEANLNLGSRHIGWSGFETRREESQHRGLLRGMGCSLYVENSGGALAEFADFAVHVDGGIVAYVGTGSSGMGIETSFAQVLADELAVEPSSIRVVQGDTDRVARGFGSHGSRSMRIGGNAIRLAAKRLIERGAQLAAEMLQRPVDEVSFREGCFTTKGGETRLDLSALAHHASVTGADFRASADYEASGPTYPNGCHLCEVEVDPETGTLRLLRFVMVKDVGRAINPLIVHGQMQGGMVQGAGQAWLEHVVYETDTGQLLSGSFLDYALPRADDLPVLDTVLNEQPSQDNALGVKGAGEGGATGAPPALVNAVLDALVPVGVTHIEMPLTPERVWRAIKLAER